MTKPDFSDLGCSSRHVISKTKSVTPHFFYISDITNSSSLYGKILRKKSMLENFRANVLKVRNDVILSILNQDLEQGTLKAAVNSRK